MVPEFDMSTGLEGLEELMGMGIWQMFASEIPSALVNLAIYIFTGLGLYTIAKRRGLRNPWLAWVPFANVWLLGCISDHYRHVVRGEVKNRRKVLLGMDIAMSAICVAIVVLCFKMLFDMLGIGLENLETMDEYMAQKLLSAISGPVVVMALLSLPLLVIVIVYLVQYLIALHDIYKSCDPSNATLYLVLGIFFSFTVPIFLMICRNKDHGMVPQQPAYYQPPSTTYRPSGYMSAAQPQQPVYQQPVYQQPQEPQQPAAPTWHSVSNSQPTYQPPTSPAEPWERKDEQ